MSGHASHASPFTTRYDEVRAGTARENKFNNTTRHYEVPIKSLCFGISFCRKNRQKKRGGYKAPSACRQLITAALRLFELQSSNTFTTGIPDWIAGFLQRKRDTTPVMMSDSGGAVRGSVERHACLQESPQLNQMPHQAHNL